MPKKVYLSLVFHNHQPVGNFDHVFREAYEKSYLPLVECLERHPHVRVGMHFTGPLRDWLLDQEPAFYDRLGNLVDNSQIEIISGAYYEPILVMLSDEDKIGQIEKLNQAIMDDFGVRPRGMWLAERVWEPSLPTPIKAAGLQYVIVDDTHFQFVGFNEKDLYGYYMTEDQSHAVAVLPSLKEMRYRLPWNEVDDFISYTHSIYADPTTPETALMLAADDGEKFGLWPGTHERCWEQGYMDALFQRLEATGDWLETIAPGDYVEKFNALGRAYLPTASYIEMTEWALPARNVAELSDVRFTLSQEIARVTKADDLAAAEKLVSMSRYLRGGFWRNFLVKYPESNHMQKRGMVTSRRVHQLPDGPAKRKALAHLWASQCNCAYWHGIFGGIYLFHIRAANYKNLLEAEALVLDDKIIIEQLDFDLDSHEEVVVCGDPFSLVIDPDYGGAVFEWDDIPSRYNLLNIMTRRFEGYHARLQHAAQDGMIVTPDSEEWAQASLMIGEKIRAKQNGLEKRLIVDQHRRALLLDHFFDAETKIDAVSRATHREMGDFVTGEYTVEISGGGTSEVTITLRRDGHVGEDEQRQPLRVEKNIIVAHGKRRLDVQYTLTNTGDQPLKTRFAIEAPFGFDGGDTEYCYFDLEDINGREIKGHLGETGCYADVDEYYVGSRIRGFEVQVALDQEVALWRFPLDTVNASEGGFETIHQGAVFLHLYDLDLAPGAQWQTRLEFEIEAIA